MSTITINQAGIDRFFQTHALNGRRAAGPQAREAARLMVAKAVQLVESGEFITSRSGTFRDSFKPIVRVDPLTGLTEVGIGSTAPYAGVIEHGSAPHVIPNAFGPRKGSAGLGKAITHPGSEGTGILRKAVDAIIPSRGI